MLCTFVVVVLRCVSVVLCGALACASACLLAACHCWRMAQSSPRVCSGSMPKSLLQCICCCCCVCHVHNSRTEVWRDEMCYSMSSCTVMLVLLRTPASSWSRNHIFMFCNVCFALHLLRVSRLPSAVVQAARARGRRRLQFSSWLLALSGVMARAFDWERIVAPLVEPGTPDTLHRPLAS